MITKTVLAGFLMAALAISGSSHLQDESEADEFWRVYRQGLALFYGGDYARGKERLREAYELADVISSQLPEHLPSSALKMEALCYLYLDELNQALVLFQEALSLDMAGTVDPSGTDALTQIGRVLYLKGEYDKALTHLKRSELAIGDDYDNPLGRTLINIGVVHFATGDYSRAMKYLRKGYERVRKENEVNPPPERQAMEQTRALQHLAALEAASGNSGKALAYLKEAVRIGRIPDLEDYNPAYLVDVLTDIGALYQRERQYDLALSALREALETSQRLGTRRLIAKSLINLGSLERSRGRAEAAIGHHGQALILGEEIGLQVLQASALAELGADYLQLGDYKESVEYLGRALETGGASLSPELKSNIFSALASCYEALGETNRALENYGRAIESVQEVRIETLSEERKIGFWQTRQLTFERVIGLLFKLHRESGSGNHAAQAFSYAEQARARALVDLLAEGRVRIQRGLPAEVLQEERVIQDQITRIRRALFKENVGRAETARMESALARVEERLEDFRERIRLNHPAYADIQYPEPYDLTRVQRDVLDEKTLLVEYLLGEEGSYLWAVTKDRCQMYKLPGRESIKRDIDRFRKLLASPTADKKAFERCYATSRNLYGMLLRPADELLDKFENLVIVPDGILHYLPFETLIKGKRGGRATLPDYLLTTHTMSTISSATVLGVLASRSRTPRDGRRRLLAYADPQFRPKGNARRRASSHTRLADIVRGGFEERGVNFEPLRFAKEEVKGIAALYPRGTAKLYVGGAATETSFKRERLTDFDFIHFATHAVIDEEFPALSGIVLSLSTEGEDEDGVLTMNEIFNLELHADLVTLSACQTGLGKLVRGEGMVGLTRAFMYAGAPSVLVSLWNVRDSSTAELMKSFYRHLRTGKSKADALREAKRDMIRSGRPLHRFPYFWAPFVLVGKG
ncbi:MAG: CHAT domain-containing protein [Acidobacteria bacterium]|nr:CHAT domain-containing protein [Acidobacteriota bacterium]